MIQKARRRWQNERPGEALAVEDGAVLPCMGRAMTLVLQRGSSKQAAAQGDRLVLENVPEGIRAGRLTVTVPERGLTLTAVLEASDYDKNLLLEGGALNHLAKLQKR